MTLEIVARTSALLIVAAGLVGLLRRAVPATRHLVWSLSIASVLLAPVLAPLAPTITVPGVPGLPEVPRVSFDAVPLVLASVQAEPGTASEQHLWNLGTIGTLGTFLAGVWFLSCWVLSGVSVWRRSRPAPETWHNEARAIAHRLGLKAPIAVRELRTDASPHVAGFFQSVVMLPPCAASWTIEARQAALVHELTHIKRHDRLTQAMAQLACAIYWFNPLVWYAAAGLGRERERACDDAVLLFGAKASAYASLLLDLARTTHSSWTPATALSMARPSAIEGRLLSILADVRRTPWRSTRWLIGATVIAITATVLGAQAMTPPVRQPPTPEPQPSKPRPLIKPPVVMALDAQSPMSSITAALVDALHDASSHVREQAAMGLAVTPGSDVIDPLLSALQDPDPQVREKAAIGLAFRRDPKIIDPLLVAIEDSDSQVREKAAIALGASGDPRALAALTKATRDPDAQVREKAVGGLLLLGLRK